MSFEPVTTLLGWSVEDLHGEMVGQVEELLIDHTDGHIAYVRFTFPADDPHKRRSLTVPWSAIRVVSNGSKSLQVTVALAAMRRLAESAH